MNVIIDHNLNVQVLLGDINSPGINVISQEAVVTTDGKTTDVSGDMSGDMTGVMNGDMTGAAVKAPLLASWPFVIGITSATLAVSIVFGILLAKRKIKKGYELYED